MYYLPKIFKHLKLTSKKNCIIDRKSKVLGGCTLLNVTLGRYSYIGFDNVVVNTEIGSFCSIANGCMIGGGSHPISHVSTSPVFHAGKNCLKKNFCNTTYNPYDKTIIGDDVWVGGRCLIKAGVKIGTGSIIGMGSVVTKDIPAYEIWGGNPAHFIKKRFEESVEEAITSTKWWDWNEDALSEYGNSFNNPEEFIIKVGIKDKI